jgi:hypothetical protein
MQDPLRLAFPAKTLRRKALAVCREHLLAMRGEGVIGDEAFHRLEEEVDFWILLWQRRPTTKSTSTVWCRGTLRVKYLQRCISQCEARGRRQINRWLASDGWERIVHEREVYLTWQPAFPADLSGRADAPPVSHRVRRTWSRRDSASRNPPDNVLRHVRGIVADTKQVPDLR